MAQPIFIWSFIVGILLFAFIIRIIQRIYSSKRIHHASSHHLLEIGRERDMFLGPWEPQDEDDDFEDL